MTETLTDVELDLVFFVERFHTVNGRAPSDNELNQRFTGLTSELLSEFKTNPLVLKSFHARGIVYPSIEDRLTAEQMHAAATMLDLVDRRSDEKRLRDIGVTPRQWATWLQDDHFAEYLRDRSEKLVANSTHELHRGLMKGVRNGNVASVKLAYELTGRYRPNEEQQIDVRRVLHSMIEILQKYIKDPVILNQIAMDLSQVATAESYSVGLANQMTTGQGPFRPALQGQTVPSPPPMEGFDD